MAIYYKKRPNTADKMQTDNFDASNGWIYRFKDCHGLVHKKLPGESTVTNYDTRDLWLERLSTLLEGYEPQDIYSVDEIGIFYNCLLHRIAGTEWPILPWGGGCQSEGNSDGSDKQVPTVAGNH
jgi:hypothetical protein